MSVPTDRPAVVEAQAWLCPLPMPQTLVLGAISYTTRDYVVLRLTSDDGFTGYAVGYTRGTPLLEALQTICRHLTGLPGHPTVVSRALHKQLAPGWGSFARAASLVDIALWDIEAQRLGTPLATVLGGNSTDVPLMAVAGYFSDTRSVDEVVDETRRFVDDGYTTLKLILHGHDRAVDLDLYDRVRAAHPETIAVAVDFHGAFDSPLQAVEHCAGLRERDVRFVEDPFPSAQWRQVAEFAQRSGLPVASGEDLPGPSGYEDLLAGGVSYLRVDVTASGGYTAGIAAVTAAEHWSAHIAPHVWPHFHAPLAAASTSVAVVEVIPDYVGAEPLWALLTEKAPIVDGHWKTPTEPGLALPLDLDAVSHYASAQWHTEIA
ncbi:hypothetical protein A4U64_27145 (plasmid) [Rhodococcus sp. WB1]|uniref:mandelate racemase/muconate lactonizing enzyme family protein n=1 Tax=Rhodococcus sp. WB1 TaxID=1033922 RepID=UPI00081A7CF1|nr:enolase C-terminal domain-like protein [Rhodococcus sp. WB1]ANZ28556.1 hypothetical protein A4U64_27145 [Rhodococcus sp. WB1]